MNKDTELLAHTAVRQEWVFSWCYTPALSLACFHAWFKKENLQSFPTLLEETTGACLVLLGDYHRHYSTSSRSFLCCFQKRFRTKAQSSCTLSRLKGFIFLLWDRGVSGNGPYQTKGSHPPECTLYALSLFTSRQKRKEKAWQPTIYLAL